MNESFPKYLDKAATKARALVPDATAPVSCVLFAGALFTVCCGMSAERGLLGILFREAL